MGSPGFRSAIEIACRIKNRIHRTGAHAVLSPHETVETLFVPGTYHAAAKGSGRRQAENDSVIILVSASRGRSIQPAVRSKDHATQRTSSVAVCRQKFMQCREQPRAVVVLQFEDRAGVAMPSN